MKIFPILLLLSLVLMNCVSRPDLRTDPSPDGSREITVSRKTGSEDSFYEVGIASWYGGKFNGRRTSNGEIYDMYKLTAAHRELPFNTIVEVENLKNRKRVIVRINDRGPFVKDRIIDLSYKAAVSIDMDDAGTAPVALRVIELNKGEGGEQIVVRRAEYSHRSEFFLQAGAFTQSGNAESLVSRLNFVSREIKFRIVEERGFFKVLSLKISERNEAERLKRSLEDLGYDTFIKEVFITGEIR